MLIEVGYHTKNLLFLLMNILLKILRIFKQSKLNSHWQFLSVEVFISYSFTPAIEEKIVCQTIFMLARQIKIFRKFYNSV